MPTIITPTPGRVVWYWPSQNEIDAKSIAYFDPTQPLAATVAYAWPDSPLVNLSVTDQNGAQFRRTSVRLVQDGEDRPHSSEGPFAEWMPYQKGQAAVQAEAIRTAVPPAIGADLAAPGAEQTVETKVYTDGSTATGAAPLPEQSPAQQEATTEHGPGTPVEA